MLLLRCSMHMTCRSIWPLRYASPLRSARDASTAARVPLLLARSPGAWVCLLASAFWLLSCSALRATAMTLLIALLWRFLLILVSERARRLSWGVAPNPAGRAFELGNALIISQNAMVSDGAFDAKQDEAKLCLLCVLSEESVCGVLSVDFKQQSIPSSPLSKMPLIGAETV